MSILLLANSGWRYAAQIKPTDASDVNTTDTTGIQNVVAGPRHINWVSGSTAVRRLAMVDISGRINCTHVVLADASNFNNHQISVLSYSAYPATPTTEYTSADPFVGPYIGKRSTDFVVPFAARKTALQAVVLNLLSGTGGVYTKTVNKFYVADSLTLSYPGVTGYRPLKFPSRFVYKQNAWLVEDEWSFSASGLTQDEKNTFEGIYLLKQEPVFLYDAAGTLISYKLLHGIITNHQFVQSHDNLYNLRFSISTLRNKA